MPRWLKPSSSPSSIAVASDRDSATTWVAGWFNSEGQTRSLNQKSTGRQRERFRPSGQHQQRFWPTIRDRSYLLTLKSGNGRLRQVVSFLLTIVRSQTYSPLVATSHSYFPLCRTQSATTGPL